MIKYFRTAGLIALAPYLVLSQAAHPINAGSSDLSTQNHLLIAEAKSSIDTTPAISGVKLLHQIFLALRGSNQLALNNPTKQLAAATQAFQGSLNPLLAIRPSEKSFNKTAPAIAMAQQDKRLYVNRIRNRNEPATAAAASAPAASFNTVLDSRAASTSVTDMPTNSKSSPAMRFEFQPNTYASIRVARNRNSNGGAAAELGGNSTSGSGGSGVNGSSFNGAANLANNMKMSPQNSKMLAQSVSKMMQSTKQLSELSEVSDSSVRTFGKAKRDLHSDRTLATLPGGPVIQEYNGATAKVSNSKDSLSSEQSIRNADSDSSDSSETPLMTPDQPGQFRYVRNQLIALLPPSVVSGIPLARLGATEQELAATLSKKNNASKQIIDDWTVWTIKGATGRGCSLQLYMRHAVVEAIRVFNPAYLGEDVGIKIGDDLPTIKVRFGEPSLILPEPDVSGNHSSSKNYVYPISHVAFQLARSKSQPSPQVVSVLIFDVQ